MRLSLRTASAWSATLAVIAIGGCRPTASQPALPTPTTNPIVVMPLVPDPARAPRPTASPSPAVVMPTPTATRAAPSGPFTELGSGSGRTQRFHLQSGEYAIMWEARPLLPSGIGCSLRGSVKTADGHEVVGTFEGQIVPGENLFSGTQDGYTLPAGDYELEVNSDCAWQVTVLTVPS